MSTVRTLEFRLLDVFATEAPFSGNPLAVFPDAPELTDVEMQGIARQLNLSETTFLHAPRLPETDAHVRIFTPSYEMPFAGHPTLGTAYVVAEQLGKDKLALGMAAGRVPVTREGDKLTLTVGLVGHRPIEVPPEAVAAAVGLPGEAVAGPVLRVDTGTEQVILPVRTPEEVERARVDGALFLALPRGKQPTKVLVWAKSGPHTVSCRFFFPVLTGASDAPGAGGLVAEDPGTGSAAANLGGWLLAAGHMGPIAGPVRWTLSQGAATGRPCELFLAVQGDQIQVGGRVVPRGDGRMLLR
jgi:trans-2,3-dihydro-3-hydroxyanthranilate isomerase